MLVKLYVGSWEVNDLRYSLGVFIHFGMKGTRVHIGALCSCSLVMGCGTAHSHLFGGYYRGLRTRKPSLYYGPH